MSKKSRFMRTFEKQQGKRAQALLKSASQHLYHIHQSMPCQLSWKMSLLLTCKILWLLLNNLTADEKYLVFHRNNSTIPIQMQLSKKQKSFSQFFLSFFKSRFNFKQFEKKRWPPYILYFRSYGLRKPSQINV